MICPTCHQSNASDSRYCAQCGTALSRACARCGHRNHATARYCNECGSALADVPSRSPDPHRFDDRAAELKQVSILFADLVSSTELVSHLDPEEAMGRLLPAVSAMVHTVKRFDGTVSRTLGDGVMAIFGAPHAHEGHALLACEAALSMQAMVDQRYGLATRIGIHSGEILADVDEAVAADDRHVHGLGIHLANRVMSVAQPNTVFVSEECFVLVRASFTAEFMGSKDLKGISVPHNVYRIDAKRPSAANGAFDGMARTTLRGRAREIKALQTALARVEDGNPHVIGISGAPGTGKSRLCFEFAKWCRGRLIPVFETRAQLYGHATPLQPVLELIRSSLFRVLPTESAEVARSRIARDVASISETFNADLPILYDFLGIAEETSASSTFNAQLRRAKLLDLIRHVVRRSGEATSVIIFDDLHWFDEASQDFVGTLVDAMAGTHTLLVVNYRSSYSAPWMQAPYFEEVALGDLNVEDVSALVEELVGSDPSLQKMASSISKRSGGNPFFAEELVRSVFAHGASGSRVTRLGANGDGIDGILPPTVQAVIAARIDQLPETEKALLQICSVIGKDFPITVLQRLIHRPVTDVEEDLEALCTAQFLHAESAVGDQWFAFRHPLFQQVAYSTQMKARRTRLHLEVARCMENYYGSRGDEFAGLMAYHHEAAGSLSEAAEWAARAAVWVGSRDSAQAILHWHKVRQLLGDEPRSDRHDALISNACSQIAWLGWRQGLTADAAKPFIAEAVSRAERSDDDLVPMMLFVEGRINIASGGSADDYVANVQRALRLVDRERRPGRTATLQAALSHAYGWAGLLDDALAANDDALVGLPEIEPSDHRFLGYSVNHWTTVLRGRLLARLGRFDEAKICLNSIATIAEAQLDPTVRFIAHLGFVDVAVAVQDRAMADEHASRIAALAVSYPSPYLRVFSMTTEGIALAVSGDFTHAIDRLTEGLAFLRSSKAAMEYETEVMTSLAECRYRCGAYESALRLCDEAIALARVRANRTAACRALLIQAACSRRLDRSDTVRFDQLIDDAKALLDRCHVVILSALLEEVQRL